MGSYNMAGERETGEDVTEKDNTEAVLPVSCVVWILCGAVIGSSVGSTMVQELIDIAYGYRWDYQGRCIIDEGYFAGGFCRAPLPCTCGDVDQIDEIHIADMTEDLFLER